VAHVTLVCIRYPWLAIESRKEEDIRTVGDLFYIQCQELEDIAFAWVWEQIVAALAEELDLSEEQIDRLVHRFLDRIPEAIRDRVTRFASIGLLKAG